MRLKIFQFIILLFSVTTMAAQGIDFEKGSWKEVVEKAKKENKLIYLDVFAEWCGPCKMMAKNVFPDERAGEKYNKLFVNYKIDAEKGEGKDVARKYAVSSYPTNLYINPHDESVVYRIPGACGVDEFLKRADVAQLDFSDTMSWAGYQQKLKENPRDYAFLETYIAKARRTGQYYDEAIDIYVDNFISDPVTDSQLLFLLTNVQNLDNKGYLVLKQHQDKIDAGTRDPRQKFVERETKQYLNNTFKKAVELKKMSVLDAARPLIAHYNPHDSIGKWYSIEQTFYKAVDDHKKLRSSYLEAIRYYEKFSAEDIIKKDAAVLNSNAETMKQSNPNLAKMSDADFQKELERQQKRNMAFGQGFSLGILNTYFGATEFILSTADKSKKDLKKVEGWLTSAEKLNLEHFPTYQDKIYELRAVLYYIRNDKERSKTIVQERIDFLKSKNLSTQKAQDLMKLIEENKLEI